PGDDPDNDKPTLSISDDVIVNEGESVEFTVSLSNPTEADLVVNLATTADGAYTAEANDFGDMVVTYLDGNDVEQSLIVDND
ncbi:hypothetical protein, partial [Vibrio sp. 10N.286.49.B3]|uniref:hypothetical protein n=1 Tax=Vibrio sp. 10N.286.49.B3 TaxID=1880855 RepID=UPI0018E402B1